MTHNKLVEVRNIFVYFSTISSQLWTCTPKQRQFSGQLYKYTNVMKGWQYRYFLVDANAGLLHYYLCEGEKPDGTVPRGSVHLAGAVICPSDEDSKTFTVNCASGDMLKLRAADARARQEWVNGLRAVAESHTKVLLDAISASSPPLPPREHLAVLDALGCVRSQLQQTRTGRFSPLPDDRICRQQVLHRPQPAAVEGHFCGFIALPHTVHEHTAAKSVCATGKNRVCYR
ncbi:hypothetical protein NQ317_012588 [Molorchus minor]|uniref:PH domain-containing protein n=1 Tax=Molorchus minor TaxID=1323400 RepID=A0ABQ9JCQ5_9CUCU|nr:hypothetical protein NQ317_012588 [Molorchus minor]